MRVLVVGAGGREHALAWKLRQDSANSHLCVAPGNAGTASVAENVSSSPSDISTLVAFAEQVAADLTIVGPEGPLAAGIVDAFTNRGLRIFGPSQAAAQIEASKIFAKELMRRHAIPTAAFEVFNSPAAALEHFRRLRRPAVIKADGLAAGKGVVIATTDAEAEHAIAEMMIRRTFGEAGRRIVIEERLEGSEASLLVLVGAGGVTPLIPAQDYKRARDGDRGPNTGGMGAIAPAGLTKKVAGEIVDSIVEPVVAAMRREDRAYTGVLYTGLMLSPDGPKVLEFNCRFGDPEAQAILPLLDGDLAPALIDVIEGRQPQLEWRDECAACVVLASGGYPGPHSTGMPIEGLDAVPDDVLVFHAGTRWEGDDIVTAGGRALNVVGRGQTMDAAVDRAYAGAGAIHFDGMQFRKDIGRRSTTHDPRPAVAIILGSESDRPVMEEAIRTLTEFGVAHEVVVASAHRAPDLLDRYVESAEQRGIHALIAAAGGAAHLAGAVAARTVLPVIGVPLEATGLGGLDALLSTVQMPPGVPVATVSIGTWGSRNAAILAVQILAVADETLRERLREFKATMAQKFSVMTVDER